MKTKNEIKSMLSNEGTTASELIELLEDCDPDAVVLFVCNYGDYGRTQQALPVVEVEEFHSSTLSGSAYSQSGIEFTEGDESEFFCLKCDEERNTTECHKCGSVCVDEEGEPVDDDDESTPVIILR